MCRRNAFVARLRHQRRTLQAEVAALVTRSTLYEQAMERRRAILHQQVQEEEEKYRKHCRQIEQVKREIQRSLHLSANDSSLTTRPATELPQTAFACFADEHVDVSTQMSAAQQVEMLSLQWRLLPDGRKEEYERLAAGNQTQAVAFRREQRALTNSLKQARAGVFNHVAARSKSRHNPYVVFASEQFKELSASSPVLGFVQLSRVVKRRWEELPSAKKTEYRLAAERNRERDSPLPRACSNSKKRTHRSNKQNSSAAQPRKTAPKKSPFAQFASAYFRTLKEADPKLKFHELKALTQKRWDELSSSQRMKYSQYQ